MTIVFVYGDPVRTSQSCLCFTPTQRSHSWCDSMGCHCLPYTVTPSIDPWHHEILQSHVGAIFQQVNTRSLTARVSQDFLRTVTTLP
ncbi:hypothetical protein TNCV_4461771 [Trichonephila clavipes]|nr:hypothetical protein TNCV_4461771 [Trichonephila clavipes]